MQPWDDHRCGLSLEKNKLRETLTEEEEMVSDACYQKKKKPCFDRTRGCTGISNNVQLSKIFSQ